MDDEAMRRLRWQCRRGLLELDLLFDRFLTEQYLSLSECEQMDFRSLLSQPDPELLAWFQGLKQPPDQFLNIIRKVSQ